MEPAASRGELEGFDTIKFTDLMQKIEEGDKSKYLFLADMSGLIADFFKYRPGQFELFYLAPELMKINMLKSQTWADVAEKIRLRVISCMLHGKTLIIDVDQAVVCFKDLDTAGVLPLDYVFYREEFFKERKPLVRDDEDKDK